MPKVAKVDLTLLKKLVGELESSLGTAEGIKADKQDTSDLHDYVIEMSKCAGLAAGIMTEATMLIGDIGAVVRQSQGPSPSDKDPLSKILGAIKGNGGLPGTN